MKKHYLQKTEVYSNQFKHCLLKYRAKMKRKREKKAPGDNILILPS